MKWPWVSRLALENALEVCRLRAAEVERERERYDCLVEKLREMQRVGFSPPPPQSSPPVQSPALPAKVMAAIRQHMDPRGPAGRSTTDWARTALSAGETEESVISRIHAGSDGDAI